MKALTVGGTMIDTIAVIANECIERMTLRNAEASFLLPEEGRNNEAWISRLIAAAALSNVPA
jgi:ribokinase